MENIRRVIRQGKGCRASTRIGPQLDGTKARKIVSSDVGYGLTERRQKRNPHKMLTVAEKVLKGTEKKKKTFINIRKTL